jgi:hypothetical protein
MFKSVDGSDVLSRVCNAIDNDNLTEASAILARDYPFTPLTNDGRFNRLRGSGTWAGTGPSGVCSGVWNAIRS